MREANFDIVENTTEVLTIRDIGPISQYRTITNDAENVVRKLVSQGKLPAGKRLFYIDSQGRKDEILVENGEFKDFNPLPQ